MSEKQYSLIEIYEQSLDREIEHVSRYILNGKCKDHAEYLARISEIHAYRRAKDNFSESKKEFLDEEEENLPSMEDEEEND